MSKTVEYFLNPTPEDRVRIVFTKDRGEITHFIVQYYALIKDRWRTIQRFDNCHGGAHRHTYHLRGWEFKVSLGDDLSAAFTEAKTTVIKQFRKIKENFMMSR